MDGEFSVFSGQEDFNPHIQKFEEMLQKNESYFFDTAVIYQIAEYYLEKGNFRKSEIAIHTGLSQHPQSVELFLMQANLEVARGKLDIALNSTMLAESLEPFNQEVYLMKGSIYSQMKDHKNAIDAFNEALKYASDEEIDIFLDLAFEYENIQEYDKAIQYLTRVLELDPDNDAALFELSFCYELSGRFQAYINLLNNYIDENPYSYIAWYNLGNTLLKTGEFAKSANAFDYAVLIREDFVSAWLNKAHAHIHLQQYEEAISCFLESMNYEEPSAGSYTCMGECYEKLDDYDRAQYYFDKAIHKDEKLGDAWLGMGVVKDLKNERKSALNYIEKALYLDEENPGFWHNYAEVLQKDNQAPEAELAYLKSISLDAANKDVWLDYTEFLSEEHSLERAIEVLQEALSLFPNEEVFIYRMVAYQLYKGDKQTALVNLENALQLNYPAHEDLLDYFPEAREHEDIVEMLEIYRNNEF